MATYVLLSFVLLVVVASSSGAAAGDCARAEEIILSGVRSAVEKDARMAASLLRLHFHDCFVQGCDASVLLDGGEQEAPPNKNSLRGLDVIDRIKAELEAVCPETVSCADILAIVARDAVVLAGGPAWTVETGRMDGMAAADVKTVMERIPGPGSDVSTLLRMFNDTDLSPTDLVALSGAHTIGKTRCFFTVQGCSGNQTLIDLDPATPTTFDNMYYVNLLSKEGILPSDQALLTGPDDVVGLVEEYTADQERFFNDFTRAMISMGRLQASSATGTVVGEIRRDCRRPNVG